MKTKHKIIKKYRQQNLVDSFDKSRMQHPFQIYKHKLEKNIIFQNISRINKKEIKILDIGCGTGRLAIEILELNKVIKYYGIDSSRNMLKKFKEKIKKSKKRKNISLHFGDASKLPFKKEIFDLVFSYHLLWHIPKKEQKKIIKEMIRVTKKKRIIIFDIINKNFLYEKPKKILKIKGREIYRFNIQEIKKIIPTKKMSLYKLLDAPIKNKSLYSIFNLLNKISKLLPIQLFHTLYIKFEK